MVNTQLKILRVFGPTAAEVSAVLRQARADGCPGLRLLERDGEFAVCIQISAPNRAMAEQYCEKWALRLRAKFGDDVFAEGETSLAQATLSAMLDRRKLLVAVDETTGRLLGSQLQPLPHSEAVFDFGTETYAHPENRKQIVVPPVLLKRFPGDVVQASAGRALNAMQAAGADFGVAYMPATVGQCPFVLVCDRHGAAACALPPDLSDAAIANQILDLLRRRLLGLRLTDSCIIFRPGKERPLLLVSEAGRERGNTVRFSLRRRTPPADDPTTSFEPMMDFDTAQPVPPAQPAAPAAPKPQPPIEVPLTVPRVPTGTIRFEEEPAVQTAEPEEDFTVTMQPEPTPADEAAPPPEPRRGAPAPSILDDDVPDFSAGLDPAAIAQAQIADDALRAAGKNTDVDAFAQAANRLFETSAAEEPASPRKKRRSAAPMQDTLPQNAIRTRSLEVIEKTERRRKRTAILTLLTLLLVVLAGAGGVWLFVHNDLGARPAAKNYGTTIYDETADRYLQKALTRRSGAVGYLGFAGRPGTLVYAADAPAPETDKDAADLVRFASPSALNSTAAGNTILSCQSDAFADFAQEEIAKQNNAFTLYLQKKTYRCKLLSVFYYDPAETGDGAFDLYATGDLSQYYDYASFVSGIQARSLWNTGADAGDDSRFITLTTQSDEDGVLLCIVGRVVEEGESAAVSTASFSAAEQPLLTAVQYSRRSQPMPDVAALVSAGLGQYAKQNLGTGAKANHAAGSPSSESTDLSGAVSELQQMTSSIMASTDTLIKGLTDLAQNGKGGTVEDDLNQGAAGTLPEQTITVDQLVSQKPTPAPTPEATPTPDAPAPEPGGDQPIPTPAPESTPAPAPAAETINVTMNGTAQTMDLVQCLAMVAQNELGPNAPDEAYKAQCVATHCWILSQSGYPSVLGATPGAAALAAAQEVAHVLVTYNGNVCFTPYFASASTGTASSAEVWGGERAWLQAVDSPYDQSVATHWNTNGATSGTARFARATLLQRIKDKLGLDLTDVDPNQWFSIQSANAYGWVAKIRVGPEGSGQTIKGTWFRENLLAGQSVDGRSLRSQCFTVSYDAGLDCFIFDVYGYGHGCGMSQWGAIGYARNGWNYQQILTHYFTGTTITTY